LKHEKACCSSGSGPFCIQTILAAIPAGVRQVPGDDISIISLALLGGSRTAS
jgi:hypothetical protein